MAKLRYSLWLQSLKIEATLRVAFWFAHRGVFIHNDFRQEIASRKIFLGAYLALSISEKHKNELLSDENTRKNTRR